MEHPKTVGDRTTLAVIAALYDSGYAVLMPFGENTRYDLVTDDGCELRRIQCKTGRLYKGAVVFSTCSNYAHHPNPKAKSRDYFGQIDAFAVYCPTTRGVYLVPIARMSRTNAQARFESSHRETTNIGGFAAPPLTRSRAST